MHERHGADDTGKRDQTCDREVNTAGEDDEGHSHTHDGGERSLPQDLELVARPKERPVAELGAQSDSEAQADDCEDSIDEVFREES